MNGLLKTSLLALSAHLLCAAAAGAVQEETLEFDGRWQVRVQAATGPARQAALSLAHYGGRWQETAPAGGKPAACRSAKPYPVTVQKSVTTELEFTVWSAAVAPGCANLSVTLLPQGPNKLAGVSTEGHAVTMTRR